jgi:hypothetical protein
VALVDGKLPGKSDGVFGVDLGVDHRPQHCTGKFVFANSLTTLKDSGLTMLAVPGTEHNHESRRHTPSPCCFAKAAVSPPYFAQGRGTAIKRCGCCASQRLIWVPIGHHMAMIRR